MANTPAVILALESSAGQATAAVFCDGKLKGQAAHVATHGHAAWMIPLAQDAVAEAGLGFAHLTHIIAGRGPGSFTGIRVALAAAKGLALSLKIGATGVSSLAGMAALVKSQHQAVMPRQIIACVDSRRGSLFFQEFSPDGTEVSAIIDGDINAVIDHIAGINAPVLIAGHQADEIAAGSDDAIAMADIAPDAGGLLAHYHSTASSIEDQHDMVDIEPLYLSAPLLGPRS